MVKSGFEQSFRPRKGNYVSKSLITPHTKSIGMRFRPRKGNYVSKFVIAVMDLELLYAFSSP